MAEKFSKRTFTILSEVQLSGVMSHLLQEYQAAIAAGKPLHVHITDKQDNRSVLQNRLYWKWLKEISNHNGHTSDDLHFEFKKKFLIAIFQRDDQQYAEMCAAIKTLKQAESQQYELVAAGVIRETSTTRMSVKQFTEYLNNIQDYVLARLGIMLTVPDELARAL